MVRRTQQRLVRLHAACDKRTHELVSRMEQEATSGEDHPTRDQGQDTVLEAVRAVAAELTTTGSSDAR